MMARQLEKRRPSPLKPTRSRLGARSDVRRAACRDGRVHARQDNADGAVKEATQALKLDDKNVEAHHILGLVYSSMSESNAAPPAGQTQATMRTQAVEHLAAIQGSPLMQTDPNLQMTLGRLQLRAGKTADAVAALEKLAQQVPWAAEPQALLAEGKITLGKIDEAVAALETAAEINPNPRSSRRSAICTNARANGPMPPTPTAAR